MKIDVPVMVCFVILQYLNVNIYFDVGGLFSCKKLTSFVMPLKLMFILNLIPTVALAG